MTKARMTVKRDRRSVQAAKRIALVAVEGPQKGEELWACTYWIDSDRSVEAAYDMMASYAANNDIEILEDYE